MKSSRKLEKALKSITKISTDLAEIEMAAIAEADDISKQINELAKDEETLLSTAAKAKSIGAKFLELLS